MSREQGDPRSDRYPLSLAYYTVPELSALETVQVAAEAGCRHVGLRLLSSQPGRDEAPLLTDPVARRQFKRALADAGITALDANTARIVAETRIEAYAPFLAVAAELGARHVLASADDPVRGRLLDRLGALCEAADAQGLTVELEFVPWLAVPDLAAAADVVRACGHRALGIAVDALHFSRSGSSTQLLSELSAGWFRYAHLCDAPGTWSHEREALIHTAVKERLPPGEGGLDLAGMLKALPEGLALALEVPMAELSRTTGARERVARIVQAARALIAAQCRPSSQPS